MGTEIDVSAVASNTLRLQGYDANHHGVRYVFMFNLELLITSAFDRWSASVNLYYLLEDESVVIFDQVNAESSRGAWCLGAILTRFTKNVAL